MHLPRFIQLYLRDRSFCSSLTDVLQYERVARPTSHSTATLHIKQLGGKSVLCRGGTSDVAVLRTTFFNQYDVPPKLLPKNATILDLGSNVGYTIAHFKALYPSSRIIGVELDRDNYELCLKNVKKYSNCRMFNAAIWTEDGSISYGGTDEQSYAVGGSGVEDKKTAISLSIPTLLALCKVTHIDYLKMDIEGAEIPILRENPDWLDIVDSMRIEVHEQPGKKLSDSLEEIRRILTQRGFTCSKDEKHWSTIVATRSATPYAEH